jgi:hypothetical protein
MQPVLGNGARDVPGLEAKINSNGKGNSNNEGNGEGNSNGNSLRGWKALLPSLAPEGVGAKLGHPSLLQAPDIVPGASERARRLK